ncbi:Extracellular solute-binding protein, family 3 [Artemisia annua]|uniref:Extracellular solute-binding protein, family 3 n=1 Tax=Artemisia annua TaxID=35608 RepID=A0A2U1LKL6_ARTAN|nr:Extracellular solute-binding protein, family 3 [Artemisia annua]
MNKGFLKPSSATKGVKVGGMSNDGVIGLADQTSNSKGSFAALADQRSNNENDTPGIEQLNANVECTSGNKDSHVSDSSVNVESSNQEKPISLDKTVGGTVDVNEAPDASSLTSSFKRRTIQAQQPVDVCAGAKWNMKKQGKSPCPTLTAWVPKRRGFSEFVNVNEYNEVEGGFSIAIFCYALHLLPYNVQPIFKPFINDKGEMNGTYDQLLRHIEGKTCNCVAGDTTIRGNRAQYVDFTIPYLSDEVYMLVRADHEWNQTLWTFLRPFTPRLWITIIFASIITGFALAILEYRASNPKFASPLYRQLMMVIWFPISTFFFHEGKIHNRCSKVVLVMWLCMIFIVVQIFTATLSSWLTLDQLRPKLPTSHENSGYQNGSFVKDLIIQRYNCSGKRLTALNSYEDIKNALANDSVSAVFGRLPYIDLFLSKYGSSEYMKFGPINQESGIAFAFAIGSPLLQNFSRAVINVTESETMMDMKKKYLGFSSTLNKPQPNHSLRQSLDVKSFIGLFIFMGIVILSAIVSSELSLFPGHSKVVAEEEELPKQATPSPN